MIPKRDTRTTDRAVFLSPHLQNSGISKGTSDLIRTTIKAPDVG